MLTRLESLSAGRFYAQVNITPIIGPNESAKSEWPAELKFVGFNEGKGLLALEGSNARDKYERFFRTETRSLQSVARSPKHSNAWANLNRWSESETRSLKT